MIGSESSWPGLLYRICTVLCIGETQHSQLETSVRGWIITTVELRRFYERFRPTLPTNDVRKRFVAKNVSGNTQDVKVQLKSRGYEWSSVKKSLRRFRALINTISHQKYRQAFDSFRRPAGGNSLRPLCPARWTMRVSSVKSVTSMISSFLNEWM